MQSLTLHHAQRLSLALAPLYAQPDAATLYRRLAAALLPLFGAEAMCFDLFDARLQARFLGAWPQHLFSEAQWEAAAPWLGQHPLSEGLFGQRRPEPLRLTDATSVARFRRTDLYDSLYRSAHLAYQLVVGCAVPGGGLLVGALFRAGRDFSEAECTLLAFVQPHLRELARLSGLGAEAPTRAALWPPHIGLTPREADVLHHLTQGYSDKEIGQLCGISWRTVQIHLHSIYGKLGVRSRTAAVRRALH